MVSFGTGGNIAKINSIIGKFEEMAAALETEGTALEVAIAKNEQKILDLKAESESFKTHVIRARAMQKNLLKIVS
jgi:hypothetical protein